MAIFSQLALKLRR